MAKEYKKIADGYSKISFDIPTKYLNQLKDIAKKEDSSVSKIIRSMIKVCLE